MIKVNLLQNVGATSAANIAVDASAVTREEQIAFLSRLGAVLIFPLCLFIWEKISVSSIQDELTAAKEANEALKKEKSKFGDTGPRVERYAKDKARIDHQTEIIRGIAHNRLREVKALDALQSLVPKKAWIKKVDIGGSQIKIEGYATTDDGIMEFIHSMENSVYFSGVQPKGTSSETQKGATLKVFKIESRLGKDE